MPSRISPPGLPDSLDYPDVPVGAILLGAARRYGERVALVHGDVTLTFAELGAAAARTANGLRARGISPGDRVAVRMPNNLHYPVAYYGILLAGAAFVPVNPLLPEAAARAQIADAEATLTLTARDFPHLGDDMPAVPPRLTFDLDTHLAHLAYTGGTTGVSKGVRHTHRAVVTNVLQYACWNTGSLPRLDEAGGLTLDQVGAEEEWPVRLGTGAGINLTPWFHVMGIIAGLNVPVMTGTTLVLHDRLDPAEYLADAERHRVTTMGGVPALFAALLAHPDSTTRDLSSVRTVASGAAPMPVEMIERLRSLVPHAQVSEGYGLTEVTMGATSAPSYRSGVRKVGSVGVPLYDTEIRVLPVEGGPPLPPGERGEICVRGPQVMEGYHNRPDATAEVLVDGWLHTGDIGVLDEDGYLFIVDRKKDMIISGGENIYSREVEEALLMHPAVAETAVIGVPDAKWGESVLAAVVLRPGASTDEAALDAHCRERIAGYKRPRTYQFMTALPRVPSTNKVDKRALRTPFWQDQQRQVS